jgi:hypothetical protein
MDSAEVYHDLDFIMSVSKTRRSSKFRPDGLHISAAKVDSLPCVGQTGLEVSVPVKPNDLYKFETEIQFVLSTFPVQPKTATPIQQLEYVYKTDTFGVRLDRPDIGSLRVVVGNIPYPISPYLSDLPEAENRTYSRHSALVRSNIDLFLPIGSVVIAPSREALIYTPFTQTAVNAALDVVETTLMQKVKDDLDAAPNEWSRYKLISEITSNLRLSTDIIVPKDYSRYHCTNPAQSLFNFAEVFDDMDFAISVGLPRRGAKYRPDGLHISAAKVEFVDCTGIKQTAICRAINAATTHDRATIANPVFFSIDKESTQHDKILNEVLAGAPVTPWADFLADLNVVHQAAAPRSAGVRRYYRAHIDTPHETTEISCAEHTVLATNTALPVVFSFQKKLYRDPECEHPVDNYETKTSARRAYQMHRALYPIDANPTVLVVKKGKTVANPTLDQWTAAKTAELLADPHYQELMQVAALGLDSQFTTQGQYLGTAPHVYQGFADFLEEKGFTDSPFAAMATYLTQNNRILSVIKDEFQDYRTTFPIPSPIELNTPFNRMCRQITAVYPDFIAAIEAAGSYGRSYLTPTAMADYLVMATERFNQTLPSTL